jgi:L-amino acid N-acyltransferase YncA
MDGRISLRISAPEDVSAIAAIYAPQVLHGTASFEVVAPNADEISRRRSRILQLGLPYLVAQAGGEIAGYAYASHFRPRTAYRFTVENSVYVAEPFQRRGVASLLMKELMQRCADRDMREMIAVIGDPKINNASVAFHHSLGFYEVGVLRGVGEKFGRALDVLVMQKTLGG